MRWTHLLGVAPVMALAGCLPPNPALEAAAAEEWVRAAQFELAVAEGFATTPDGIRLYYRVAGDRGPVVIAPFALYHGSALDGLAKGRRVVTYDPRGRGRSAAAPLERVNLDYLLTDMDTVRRAVGAETISIIGYSGSGMEMFVYALRNPGRVERLVQLAPVAARADPWLEGMMADRERRTDVAARDRLRVRVAAGDFADDPVGHCRAQSAITQPAIMADPANARLVPDVCGLPNEHPATIGAYFGALWPSISTYDWRSALARVTIPRLVVYPLQDNIPRAGVEEWVRGQPNARIVYVERSGHIPQYENPAATLPAIDRFLSGEWPPDARSLP